MRRLLRLGLLLAVSGLALPAAAPAQVPCVPPLCQPDAEPTPTPTPGPDEPPPGPPPPPPTELSGTATFQADPGHTGWVPRSSLIAPLRVRWTRELAAGQPLAGDGRVYVVGGGALRALDPRTGRDLWAVPVNGRLGAFDAGRLFVTAGGFLNAYSAADGRQLWATRIDSSYALSTTPVATGGSVYTSTDDGASEILALDAETGKIRWRAEGNGTGNTPAVDAERVYASYACGWTFAWNRAGGRKRWNSTSDCSGGGGSTPVVSGGRLYVPENSAVHEAATGKVLGTYPGGMPVIADGVAIYRNSSVDRPEMQGVDPVSGRLLWSAKVPAGSGSDLGSTFYPLAVASAVYTVSQGVVSAHAVRTGQPLWSAKLAGASTVEAGESEGIELGAAPDLLLVAGLGRLTAFESAFTPPPGGIDIGVTRPQPFIGQRVGLGGLLGSDLRGKVSDVAVEGDRAPFGGGYRRLGRVRPNGDGFFVASLRPDRNVRLRVRAGDAASAPIALAVLPRYRFRFRTVGRRVRIGFSIRAARDLRLAGRRAHVYLGRMKSRRYERLGAARLRRTGRGRTAGAIVVPPPRGVGSKDVVALCIPRQVRLGLGAADVLTRRCGARSVRWR